MTDTRRTAETARAWLASLDGDGARTRTAACPAGDRAASALGALIDAALERNWRLLVVTEDDAALAAIADALEVTIRPLCLVLPTSGPVQPVVLRAAISLLKSRLARDTDAGPWHWQRRRLADMTTEWQRCLAWCDSPAEPLPGAEAQFVFPVLVMPAGLAREWSASADRVIVFSDGDLPAAWPGAQRILCLRRPPDHDGGYPAVADLARRAAGELELLEQELADLELELATAHAEIADFSHRYHAEIGSRIARLDALQAEMAARRAAADAEDIDAAHQADQARRRAERSQREHAEFTDRRQAEAATPFRADDDMKKLFRRVAQRIHPDRAQNEADRLWRTQLMAEANRAYRANDRAALAEVLALWTESAGATALEATANATERAIARLKRRIGEIETELNRLFGSKLYELFTAAGIAARVGRDLLKEMAERLDADIRQAESSLVG